MKVTIVGGGMAGCKVGLKSTGNVDLSVDGTEFQNNQIDIEITGGNADIRNVTLSESTKPKTGSEPKPEPPELRRSKGKSSVGWKPGFVLPPLRRLSQDDVCFAAPPTPSSTSK